MLSIYFLFLNYSNSAIVDKNFIIVKNIEPQFLNNDFFNYNTIHVFCQYFYTATMSSFLNFQLFFTSLMDFVY
jgi:hypothetical protein